MSDYLSRLSDCVFDRWTPKIGDPTLAGWLTVAAYCATAVLALAIFAQSDGLPEESRRREMAFWLCVFLAMAALGVNKQLDLQSFGTALGRCVSKLGGWYERRQTVQVVGVLALLAAVLAGGCAVVQMMRGLLRRYALAIAGLVFIGAFVLVRAVGFTHLDALIHFSIQNGRMNLALELGGVILLAAGAARILASCAFGAASQKVRDDGPPPSAS